MNTYYLDACCLCSFISHSLFSTICTRRSQAIQLAKMPNCQLNCSTIVHVVVRDKIPALSSSWKGCWYVLFRYLKSQLYVPGSTCKAVSCCLFTRWVVFHVRDMWTSSDKAWTIILDRTARKALVNSSFSNWPFHTSYSGNCPAFSPLLSLVQRRRLGLKFGGVVCMECNGEQIWGLRTRIEWGEMLEVYGRVSGRKRHIANPTFHIPHPPFINNYLSLIIIQLILHGT